MRARVSVVVTLSLSALLLVACDNSRPVGPTIGPGPSKGNAIAPAKPTATQIATVFTLPTLSGRNSEALAVNNDGTVIAGSASERRGTLRAVRWMLQANGSWAISALPLAVAATGATARGVNRAGDVAGNDFPGTSPHVVLWPAGGGFSVLGCNDLGEGFGLSADAQVVVGVQRVVQPGTAGAAVWRPGNCREDLPALVAGGWSRADAVNGDGTIVGGTAAPGSSGDGFPARWTQVAGAWQVDQLDQRPGQVSGANVVGDLAGGVTIPCALAQGCLRAFIWYAAGGSRELGTLGGDVSLARAINASGEVVGPSALPSGINTAYFWSESLGMVQLPFNGKWAAANAVSDVRPDGSRLVVGMSSRGQAIGWVVRNP